MACVRLSLACQSKQSRPPGSKPNSEPEGRLALNDTLQVSWNGFDSGVAASRLFERFAKP